jgi:hypothetical protein
VDTDRRGHGGGEEGVLNAPGFPARARAHPALRTTFLVLASVFVALACALATHRLLQSAQGYPQLVVGSLAWNAGTKAGDIPAALAFMLVLPLAWGIVRAAADAYHPDTQAGLCALQFACVSGAVWLAQVLFVPRWGAAWLYVCAGLVVWWVIGGPATAWPGRTRASDGGNASDGAAVAFVLIPVLGGFSALGVLLLVNRGFLVVGHVPAYPIGFGVVAAVLLLVLWRSRGAVDWRRLVGLSQIGIPLLALGVIPTPIVRGAELVRIVPISWPLAALSALIAIVVLVDILRTARRDDTDVTRSLASPLALFLCLWILRLPFTEIPVVSIDDWHFGELLLPWASWRDFGLVPFADLMPVRGFVSVADAALTQVFLSGSAADLTHLRPTLALLYAGVVFWAMRYAAGTLAALVAVAVLDFASPITRIDYLYVAGFCVQTGLALRGRCSSAAIFWLVSSMAFFVLAPGQGVLYALATAPLLAHAVWHASGRQRAGLASATSLAALGLVALVLASPTLGQVWVGIRHYFGDNVVINTVGSAIPWTDSFELQQGQGSLVREAFRSFFLIVAACMAWAAVTAWRRPSGAPSGSALRDGFARLDRIDIAIATSIVLTVLMFLPRVLGRIDTDSVTRLGALTLLACALAPLITARRFDLPMRGAIAVASIFLATGNQMNPGTPNDGPAPFVTNALKFPRLFNLADGLVDETASGMHGVGAARFDQAHLAGLRHLRRLIDEMLPARTPYYDFSNRNAHYVYFDRPVPTRWSSPYYLADERAQVRTAGELAERQVPLLLLSADNIAHDGGSAALRAYWLYRFVLANYLPFERDGYVFAVRKDLAREPGFAGSLPAPGADVALFEEAFAVTDLKSIPLAWGSSANALDRSFAPVRLDATILDLGNGRTGLAPASPPNDRAGLPRFDMLRLSLHCTRPVESMHLRWSAREYGATSTYELAFAPASGMLLVPVGARPAWTLAEEISDVTLDTKGSACSVNGAQWLQRQPPVAGPQ